MQRTAVKLKTKGEHAMWRPSKNAPTEELYLFGVHHLAVLKHYPESNPLVEQFTEINDALMSARKDKLVRRDGAAPGFPDDELPQGPAEAERVLPALAALPRRPGRGAGRGRPGRRGVDNMERPVL